jgi:hypothetical protein
MIYMYYKKLKQYITKSQANGGATKKTTTLGTTPSDLGKPGSQLL